jgi:hypothetical protein
MDGPGADHFELVAEQIRRGAVVPFLGAGASLCDRPVDEPWERGRYLPSGVELASVLAERSRYPDKRRSNLVRVSQYLDAKVGSLALYKDLRGVFEALYPANSLHEFFASLPPLLRGAGVGQQLIITTNYDRALEEAFDRRSEPYDLIWYEEKKNEHWGKFLHRAPGEAHRVIRAAKKSPISCQERTVILKLHGAVHEDPRLDSFVITEDSYIDYLSQGDISQRIPVLLREQMKESHLLFLGYSMSDWNLRVILNRMSSEQPLENQSWAVQLEPDDPGQKEIEYRLWRRHPRVELFFAPLRDYIARLRECIFAPVSTSLR